MAINLNGASAASESVREAIGDALNSQRKAKVISDSNATRTLAATDLNSHIRSTHAVGYAVTVPPDATLESGDGDTILFEQAGAGPITFAAGSGVTINYNDTPTENQGDFCGLKWVAANTWSVV